MSNDNIYNAPKSDLRNPEQSTLIYAGFWIRVIASLIDTVLLLMVSYPILTMLYGADYFSNGASAAGIMDILISYIFPVVVVVLFWVYKSATPGKMIVGIKVISLGESPKLSVGQAIIRYIGYYPAMLVLFIGIFWIAFDKRKQGWHDKIAKTVVVKK